MIKIIKMIAETQAPKNKYPDLVIDDDNDDNKFCSFQKTQTCPGIMDDWRVLELKFVFLFGKRIERVYTLQ